ncbi:hypothetical protein [Streptomyces albipurpureus]|uniref:Secreted protein n=1 Tax=Streptomyces albipurpureus TaxID=2897419 RepID=A0ABT0UTP0_9ACTN|nr:hypothetical protein [Streptomyces sp. CWNU-1]MCM2390596.1 hypothetical protein [Streptomyces sp. CWNU-1]
MRQRGRLLLAATVPTLLLGVWATFLVLVGAPHPTGATTVTTASMSPVVPVRTDGPQRGGSPRQEARPDLRRAPVAVVQETVAADTEARLPLAPPAPAGPVAFDFARPLTGDTAVGPRQERAPPHHPYSPRHTRAPPSTSSS